MDLLNQKTIAIHQPNYLPWPGYFYKISKCHEFVFLDHVRINKSGFTRRTLIPDRDKPGETEYLSVPLRKFSDSAAINSLLIDYSRSWQSEHLNKISAYYRKFPFFEESLPLFERIFEEADKIDLLSELNIYLIKEICSYLGIACRFHRSSDMNIHFQKNEMNAEIVKQLGGNTYLSGEGAGKTYQDEEVFVNEGLQLKYTGYLNLLTSKPFCDDSAAMKCGIHDMMFRLGSAGIKEYFKKTE